MRITRQLLQEIASDPVEEVLFLDLSSRKIVVIEHLQDCKRLHTLILEDNIIDTVGDIEWCRELWNIDLSGNKIKSLHGLSRFPALGSLVLANNNLDWFELKRLSHIHLLSLSLSGNPKLTNDPKYRYHVIDILPHLWMLDGQLITAGERKRVQHFFAVSAASAHPVRHKINTHSIFVPSNLQNLLVTGVFGEKTIQLMAKFPVKYTHNIDLDRKRLVYLASILEDDLKIENEYRTKKGEYSFTVPSLQKLLDQRSTETEQCNMLLLLLVTSLEFQLPYDLMVATLDTAKISTIGDFACHELFSLPYHIILKVVSLLLSGAAIDRDKQKENGLYPQLYQGLQSVVFSLHGTISQSSSLTAANTHCANSMSINIPSLASSDHQHYRCLIASEVVHLMCLVPIFFDHLENNTGVLEMVAVATNNRNVGNIISQIAWRIQNRGGDIWDLYHEIASYLLQTTTAILFTKKQATRVPRKSQLYQVSSQIIQTPRRFSPQPRPRAVSAGRRLHSRNYKPLLEPELGDLVMCPPERLARIVALPEPRIAVLQFNNTDIKGFLGPPDSYFYTDPCTLVWDAKLGHWICDDLSADMSTGRLHPSPNQSQTTLLHCSSTESTISRPQSQLSYISDLETIPSVEELALTDADSTDGMPMKVDISSRQKTPIQTLTTQRPKTPEQMEEAKYHHQQHVLEQYTLNKAIVIIDEEVNDEEETQIPNNDVPNIVVPTPKLSLPQSWSSAKSLPQSLSILPSTKPHSCVLLPQKVNSGIRKLSSDSSSISKTNVVPFEEKKPIVIDAWSPVNSGVHPKQTKVSITRAHQRMSKSHSSYSTSQTSHFNSTAPFKRAYSSHTGQRSFSKSRCTRKLGDIYGLSVRGTSTW